MKPTQIPLHEGKFYHIYNRGNNRETLFYTEANYKYFLKKYDKYLSEYIDTYAYCLLPNHFHLLISVKELKDIPLEKVNIILNLAIQNDKYKPNESTVFPGIFEIDYVRYYSK